MYRFYINNIDNDYHYSELCRVFLDDSRFEVIGIHMDLSDLCLGKDSYFLNAEGSDDRDTIKRELYHLLTDISGIKSDWGTLTGVRPLKLAYEIYSRSSSIEEMQQILKDNYCLADSKIMLLTKILQYQIANVDGKASDHIAVYIGIPFCPTRCAYCAFASNVAPDEAIEEYLCNLLEEIRFMGELIRENGSDIESLYIGGGTPTTLNSNQLERLINAAVDDLGVDPYNIEFTIEAGRPDTITAEKLSVMKEHGISRISINPQSMKDATMKLIGRDHCSQDIINAYNLASEYDFDVINADLIAGLPEEDLSDFKNSLDTVMKLGANNITIHTLSVKSGSRLKEEDPEYYRRNVDTVAAMLSYAYETLSASDFIPYYIYRQKHQIGAQENIGYCRPGQHSIYNIRIMEEKQTIIGLGAGAIGKVYFPEEDRLERIPNVSNYIVYNERFDEMLERKKAYYGG